MLTSFFNDVFKKYLSNNFIKFQFLQVLVYFHMKKKFQLSALIKAIKNSMRLSFRTIIKINCHFNVTDINTTNKSWVQWFKNYSAASKLNQAVQSCLDSTAQVGFSKKQRKLYSFSIIKIAWTKYDNFISKFKVFSFKKVE